MVDEATKRNLSNLFTDKNNDGYTPVNYSASHAFIKAVKSLTSTEIGNTYNRAKDDIIPDFKDKAGNTALNYATAKGDYKTAKLLIESGARADIENNQKQKPKDLVINESRHSSTFGWLLNENNQQKRTEPKRRSKPPKSGSYAENAKKPASKSRNC